jgi:hypothetical protein
MMKYRCLGRSCDCSGEPVNLILRTVTEKDIAGYEKEGMHLSPHQAVLACPKCGGCIIEWLFMHRGVEKAKQALSQRYMFEEIKDEN